MSKCEIGLDFCHLVSRLVQLRLLFGQKALLDHVGQSIDANYCRKGQVDVEFNSVNSLKKRLKR